MAAYKHLSAALSVWLIASALGAPAEAVRRESGHGEGMLWVDPVDIKSRNLYYGPGGEEDQPQMPLEFLKEQKEGASPKFDVRDATGKKWRMKLGPEAQPEIVASRLLWAVGFAANENYFFPEVKVDNLAKLSRGQNFLESAGRVRSARLQRREGKKVGRWSWRHNPFVGTREFNGLRVMMALISNWDLKDENNAVYDDAGGERKLYEVSDVGSSFGMNGKSYTDNMSKNNLRAYRKSRFISKVTADYVDFNFPTHPPFLYVFDFPLFFTHTRMHWVGQHVPRTDARWMGSVLVQLSREQICDAFRAAGYTPQQVDAYADAVQARIAQLNRL
jgi:hypothetical protein